MNSISLKVVDYATSDIFEVICNVVRVCLYDREKRKRLCEREIECVCVVWLVTNSIKGKKDEEFIDA